MTALLKPARAPVAADDLYRPIAEDLVEVERVLQRHLTSARPGVARLLHHLGHYRGKRLRPALLLLTARACGTVAPAHHVLAAVVEMIHTATLVHDDVLDNASVRRHAATVNAAWGNQASILLGDYLFTHAFHLCSTLDDPRACRIIGESTNRVCAGELHQISARGNLALGEDEYLAIIDAKTAELTSCCCRLGALFANVPADTVEQLADYGRYLGLSFQIADDLLDLVGDEDRAGKSLGTDLDQQKLTLPLIRLLARAPETLANRIRQVLRQEENHKREALAADLASSGVLDDARATAVDFARRARRRLECLPASECRDLLATLTEHVVHRQT